MNETDGVLKMNSNLEIKKEELATCMKSRSSPRRASHRNVFGQRLPKTAHSSSSSSSSSTANNNNNGVVLEMVMDDDSSSLHLHSSDDLEFNPFATLLSPLPPPNPAEHQHLRRHHVTSLNADIVIRQLPSEGLSFQLWPAATTLYSLLDAGRLHSFLRPGNRRLRVLELGSGTGLVGIAAAAVLGADVTVTDLGHVIPNLNYNVALNADLVASGGGAVVAAELGWGNVEQMEVIGREFDVILGSDVVYHDHLYEPLLETLKYFVLGRERKREGEEMVFVMAHLKRWKKESVFFKKARKVFDIDVIHRESPADGKRVGVTVYRFAAKPRPLLEPRASSEFRVGS